jgi:thiosulfate reductase cytochrome b subunit
MIIVYIRLGESIWGAEHLPFSIHLLVETFRDASFTEFLHRFGMAGVHAFTAWLLTLPLLVFSLNRLLRPLIRRIARRLPSTSASPSPSTSPSPSAS